MKADIRLSGQVSLMTHSPEEDEPADNLDGNRGLAKSHSKRWSENPHSRLNRDNHNLTMQHHDVRWS